MRPLPKVSELRVFGLRSPDYFHACACKSRNACTNCEKCSISTSCEVYVQALLTFPKMVVLTRVQQTERLSRPLLRRPSHPYPLPQKERLHQPERPLQVRKPLHPPKRAKRNPRKKTTVTTTTMMMMMMIRKRKTARTTSRPDSVWRPSGRQQLLRGESSVRKRPVRLLARTTSAVQFAVSSDMSIRVRPSYLTRSVQVSPFPHQEIGAEASLDSTNQRARGRSWRYHPANWCDILPRRGDQDQDRCREQGRLVRVQDPWAVNHRHPWTRIVHEFALERQLAVQYRYPRR